MVDLVSWYRPRLLLDAQNRPYISYSLGRTVHHIVKTTLATALRQGALQGATSWVFYLPLALFMNPRYAGHAMLNTLGQF